MNGTSLPAPGYVASAVEDVVDQALDRRQGRSSGAGFHGGGSLTWGMDAGNERLSPRVGNRGDPESAAVTGRSMEIRASGRHQVEVARERLVMTGAGRGVLGVTN